MNLVSVVIPAYNRGPRIGAAVRSVLTQTHTNVEVILVDDASTDNTSDVVERFVRESTRVYLLRHAVRMGAQAARNTGIRAARGEWIGFLDSDDQWLPESVSVRLRAATYKGVHVVHSECDVLRPGSAPQRFGVPATEGWAYKEMLRRPGPVFPGLLVSKKALDRIGLLDETIVSHQEWDLAIRLAQHYEFAFVREPTFIYDCRSADTISGDLQRTAQGYEQVFAKHRWAVLRHLGPRALASHYEAAATLYSAARQEEHARRCVKNAFVLWPFRPGTIVRRIQRLLRSPLRQGV